MFEIPTVEIHVKGGIAEVVEKPEGICVIIKDFDDDAEEKVVESICDENEMVTHGMLIC